MNNTSSVDKLQKEPKHLYEMFCSSTTKRYHDYKRKNLKQLTTKVVNILNKLHLKPVTSLLDDLLDNTKAHFSSIVESNNNKGIKYFIKVILKEDALMNKMIADNRTLGKILKNNKDIELGHYTPPLVESNTNFLLYEFVRGRNVGSRYNDSSIISKTENDQIIAILKSLLSFDITVISPEIESYGKDFFQFYINHGSYLLHEKNVYKKYVDDEIINIIERLSHEPRVLTLINKNVHFLAHNDFRPANIINADGTMKIIDWDLYGKGIKFHDVARFYNFYYSNPAIQETYLKTWLQEKMTDDERTLLYVWFTLESFHETNMVLRRLNEVKPSKDLDIIKNNFYKRINKLVVFTDTLSKLLY